MKRTLFLLPLIFLSCSKDENEPYNTPLDVYQEGTVLYSELSSPNFSENVEEVITNLGTKDNKIFMNITTKHTINDKDVLLENDDIMIFRTLTKDQLLELAENLSEGLGYKFLNSSNDPKNIANKLIVLQRLKELHASKIDLGQIYNVMNISGVPIPTIHKILEGSLTRSGSKSDIGTVISDIERFGYDSNKIVKTKSVLGAVALFTGGVKILSKFIAILPPTTNAHTEYVSYLNDNDGNSFNYVVGKKMDLSPSDPSFEAVIPYTYKYGTGKNDAMISATFYISLYYQGKHNDIKGLYIPQGAVNIEKSHTGNTMHQEITTTFDLPTNVGTDDNPIISATGEVRAHYYDSCLLGWGCDRIARLRFVLNAETGFKETYWVEKE